MPHDSVALRKNDISVFRHAPLVRFVHRVGTSDLPHFTLDSAAAGAGLWKQRATCVAGTWRSACRLWPYQTPAARRVCGQGPAVKKKRSPVAGGVGPGGEGRKRGRPPAAQRSRQLAPHLAALEQGPGQPALLLAPPPAPVAGKQCNCVLIEASIRSCAGSHRQSSFHSLLVSVLYAGDKVYKCDMIVDWTWTSKDCFVQCLQMQPRRMLISRCGRL